MSDIELTESGDQVEISVGKGVHDNAFVIHIDTSELPEDRVLRVNVNDAAVYNAHVERGDHNLDYLGEYIDEVNRRR